MAGNSDREDEEMKVNAALVMLENRIIELERAIEMIIARMPGGDYAPRSASDDPEWYL